MARPSGKRFWARLCFSGMGILPMRSTGILPVGLLLSLFFPTKEETTIPRQCRGLHKSNGNNSAEGQDAPGTHRRDARATAKPTNATEDRQHAFWAILPALATAVISSALIGGCMKSRATAPGEFDRLYIERENIMQHADADDDELSDRLPERMIIISEGSTWASVNNLLSAGERLRQGEQDDLRLLVTPEMAAEAAEVLQQLSEAIQSWSEDVAAYAGDAGREKWAEDAAKVFAVIYRVDYGSEAADPRPYANRRLTHLSQGAPLARSVLEYIGRQSSGGSLFEDGRLLGAERRRQLVIQFGLAGVFQAADLRIPRGALEELSEIMEQGPLSAVVVQGMLKRKLLELRRRAESDERPIHRNELTGYLDIMPPVLNNLARLLEQWDKFYLVVFEVAEIDGRMIGSLVADVRPGYEVRIDQLHSLAPALTGKGRFRLNFWQEGGGGGSDDEAREADESRIIVQAINERGGQAAVRFEQWFYDLAGLFAFPLDDWSLHSVEVVTRQPEPHLKLTDVTVLMNLVHYEPGEDSRRAIRVSQARRLVVESKGERVDRFAETSREIEFHTPEKVWYDSSTSRTRLPGP